MNDKDEEFSSSKIIIFLIHYHLHDSERLSRKEKKTLWKFNKVLIKVEWMKFLMKIIHNIYINSMKFSVRMDMNKAHTLKYAYSMNVQHEKENVWKIKKLLRKILIKLFLALCCCVEHCTCLLRSYKYFRCFYCMFLLKILLSTWSVEIEKNYRQFKVFFKHDNFWPLQSWSIMKFKLSFSSMRIFMKLR